MEYQVLLEAHETANDTAIKSKDRALSESRNFFVAASEKEVDSFFKELYALKSPQREARFIEFCLKESCSERTRR